VTIQFEGGAGDRFSAGLETIALKEEKVLLDCRKRVPKVAVVLLRATVAHALSLPPSTHLAGPRHPSGRQCRRPSMNRVWISASVAHAQAAIRG
jgi:hypothetical protein